MKKLKKCIVPVLLTFSILCGTVTGNYRQVQAAEVVAGMETIQWIISLAASVGFTVSVADLVGKSRDEVKDWDSYDWGNLLDDPVTGEKLKDAEEKIEKLYYGSTEAYKKTHGSGQTPTPVPTSSPVTSPPVTATPPDPDWEPPEDWFTIKQKAGDKGILSMVGATAYCMKEALSKFWDDIVNPVHVDEELPDDVKNIIKNSGFPCYMYTVFDQGSLNEERYLYLGGRISFYYSNRVDMTGRVIFYLNGKLKNEYNNASTGFNTSNYKTNMRKFNSYKEGKAWADEQLTNAEKNIPKAAIIPDLTRKQAYDNNSSIGDSTSSGSGSSPGSDTDNPFNFKIPTIDEIKDFLKDLMGGDEDDQPAKVTNFITNHTVQPTPAPNPTTAPDPGGGGSGGGSTDPDNPDSSDDVSPDDYKTDLRLVFPFCIPFDLIHLLNAFDAEPEAPVFEFPLDIDLNNPFSGGKVVDYHQVFTLDMSDYESVVEILRIFQVIFFIIALMMITRQQMIKG